MMRRFFPFTGVRKEEPVGEAFISVWDTRNTSSGSSASNQISLPLKIGGEYDFTVYWGDGTSDKITAWDQPEILHTYPTEGVYTAEIYGEISGWRFANGGDRLKILDVSAWGKLSFTEAGSSGGNFQGCANLKLSAPAGGPNLSKTWNLGACFQNCTSLEDETGLQDWDCSSISSFANMFNGCHSMNSDLNGWVFNTSGITINMSSLFANCRAYNKPMTNWTLENVTIIQNMFANCWEFNQSVNHFDVSKVTVFQTVFLACRAFNQPLNNWDVSMVTNFNFMFRNCNIFNQDLPWSIRQNSNVTMEAMFDNCPLFNGDVTTWDVSRVTNLRETFRSCPSFTRDLSIWNPFNGINMLRTFFNSANINFSFSNWDISNVTNATDFMHIGGLSTTNYDQTLNAWANLPLQSGVSINFANSKYSSAGASARQYIIDTFGWTITDGGQI